MFERAYAVATKFTRPVITCARRWDGRISTGFGAFVVVNDDGWVLTAGHMFVTSENGNRDRVEVEALQKKIQAAEANTTRSPAKLRRELQRLNATANRDWITQWTYWWAGDGIQAVEGFILREADLALCRLDPFPDDWRADLPVFRAIPKGGSPGRSLCRLGFPFSGIDPTYDEASDKFELGSPSITFFPNDGIFTRTLDAGASGDGHPLLFVETSSPGIPGQSGGPIVDVDGAVWGIQTKTQHIPLGFAPEIKDDRGRVLSVEHQVMNLGIGVHSETIQAFAKSHGVELTVA